MNQEINEPFKQLKKRASRHSDKGTSASYANLLLFYEHMRRMTTLSNTFSYENRLAPIAPPEIILGIQIDWTPYQKFVEYDFHHIRYARLTYQNEMKWQILQKMFASLPDNLESPYEPLLVLFERGGSFYPDKASIWDVGIYGIRTNYRERSYPSPVVELDSETLQRIDEEDKKKNEERE